MSKRSASPPATGPPARRQDAVLFRYLAALPWDPFSLLGELLDQRSNINLRLTSPDIYQRLARGRPGNMNRRWRLPALSIDEVVRRDREGVPPEQLYRTSDDDVRNFIDRFWDPRGGDSLSLRSLEHLSDFARLDFANVSVTGATDPVQQLMVTTAPWSHLAQNFRANDGYPFVEPNHQMHPEFILAPNTTSLTLTAVDDENLLPRYIAHLKLVTLKVINHTMREGAPLPEGMGGVFSFNPEKLRVFHFERHIEQPFDHEEEINQTLVASYPHLEELRFSNFAGFAEIYPNVLELKDLRKLVLRGRLAESIEDGALTWAGVQLFPEGLEVLELCMFDQTHVRELLALLPKAPRLKRLVLDIHCPCHLDFDDWIPQSLEHLDIRTNLDAATQLPALPNLKTLIVRNHSRQPSRITDTSGEMPQLQRLQLTNFSSAGPLRGRITNNLY